MCSVSTTSAKKRSKDKDCGNTEQKSLMWDMLTHMQANIDDCSPEVLAHAIDLLMNNGAIDAWIHPIIMKKGRPAHSLHCICRSDTSETSSGYVDAIQSARVDIVSTEHRLLNIMFRHTTTLGIRTQRNILRAALRRKFVEVQLPYKNDTRQGKVNVKISSLNGEVVSVKAEFEHCKIVSEGNDVPLKAVSRVAEQLGLEHYNITN
mmetsp:Transcript_4049/g.10273  ORF Transcript_4049/g.10273 Transcript_4049/m.10273 type:complete len:206 (+) Transcript_4049:1483-2100(+)